jgi:hypothetical protein
MVREPHHDKKFYKKIINHKSKFINLKYFLGFQRAIQCGGFCGFRFFWVTSKEVPRVDSRKSPVEVKKSKPSKIYLALEIKATLWH